MEPKCNHVFQKHKHDPDPQVCDEPFSGIENPKAPRIVACALANGAIALPVCFMQQLRRSAERRPSRRQMVQKAAEQGHGEAQFKLGALREEGDGARKDIRLAAKWLKKAANLGDANAQGNLWILCEEGEGVPKSGGLAVKRRQKAAKQGSERLWQGLTF